MGVTLSIFFSALVVTRVLATLPPPCVPETVARRIDNVKSFGGTLNALTLVGAFLAAVQAQMISFTYTANQTNLQVITNTFSFLGLALDIVGTSLGLWESAKLQKDLEQLNRLLSNIERMPQIRQEIRDISVQLESMASPSSTHSEREKHELKLALADKMEQENESMFLFRTHFRYSRIPASFQVTGTLPLNALIGGLVCFIAGLFCFIRATQPHVVFYITLFVTLGLLGVYVVATKLAGSNSTLKSPERGSEYLNVKERISQLRDRRRVFV